MMEWESQAIILSVRAFGENDGIVTVFAEDRGLWKGFVKGVSGKTGKSLWQTGNILALRWKSRLSDGLGYFSGELVSNYLAAFLSKPTRLYLGASVCALLEGLCAEREVDRNLYEISVTFLNGLRELPSNKIWEAYIAWELHLLKAQGYGLSLNRSVLSGEKEGLRYVSPKTGAAVTEEEGLEWKDKLLVLPLFMTGDGQGNPEQWQDGLSLTGHFLLKAFHVHGVGELPASRKRLKELLEKQITRT